MNEDLSIEEFRRRFYSIMNVVPSNYVMPEYIDARAEYKSSGKTGSELAFIIERIEKLPTEYNAMIEKEAAKSDSKKSQKECKDEVNCESIVENSPLCCAKK